MFNSFQMLKKRIKLNRLFMLAIQVAGTCFIVLFVTVHKVSPLVGLSKDRQKFTQSNETLQMYPPYKVYVHELPSRFNEDLTKCSESQRKLTGYSGFGNESFRTGVMSIRDTWQFTLELIIHNKLQQSPYRTFNEKDADVFYLPFYSAFSVFCGRVFKNAKVHSDFFRYVEKLKSFKAGKPHVMALGMIERKHANPRMSMLLKSRIAKNITFIGIEQESKDSERLEQMTSQNPLIVAPYPSFGHLFPSVKQEDLKNIYKTDKRNIFLLFAGGVKNWKPTNGIRKKILIGNIVKTIKTVLTYENYFKANNRISKIKYISLYVDDNNNFSHLFSWMRKSVFCLQPEGNSATRKSFYDAIMCGCIPVIFTYNYKVRYPFEEKIDYGKLTVTINQKEVKHSGSLYSILSKLDNTTIFEKQQYMYKVMNYLQYSYPILNGTKHDDAMQYIMDEIGTKFKLQ